MLDQVYPYHSNRTVPNHNKYTTGTDVCMPLVEDSVSQERVVSTTQTRLTGAGGSQHTNLDAPRFAKLREKMMRVLETGEISGQSHT